VFDYLNLRTNDYDFHMALTKGEVARTDGRVRATMANWRFNATCATALSHGPTQTAPARCIITVGRPCISTTTCPS